MFLVFCTINLAAKDIATKIIDIIIADMKFNQPTGLVLLMNGDDFIIVYERATNTIGIKIDALIASAIEILSNALTIFLRPKDNTTKTTDIIIELTKFKKPIGTTRLKFLEDNIIA